jgi:predicted phosphodiesterase
MRIRVLSDLHLEFGPFTPPNVPADVVVLAGDIVPEHYGIEWARQAFPETPVIYVAGNHEYYAADLEAVLMRTRERAAQLGVHYLERDQVVIDGVRFLGTTLWTDFDFPVGRPALSRTRVDWIAREKLTDFRVIRYRGGMLHPDAWRDLHRESRAWLTRELSDPFEGPTVVVTHHLPHERSVHAEFTDHPLNPTFVSHIPDLVRAPVDLWIHGHTHCSMDYVVNGTRVICNPRGYAPADLNKEFDPTLVLKVPAAPARIRSS